MTFIGMIIEGNKGSHKKMGD